VRAALVICIASLYREFDLVSEALDWAWDIWSDPASPVELRFGAAVAWLNLTDQVMPPELRRLLDELPAPTVYELAQQLPWISWRRHVSNGIELWWEVLTR
jgi:hypothetical protein